MTEQILNVAWLAIAIFAFAYLLPRIERRRRLRAALVLAGVLALLFPIISISDDLNVDWSAQDVVAVLFTVAALVIVLAAIARLVSVALQPVAFETVDLSDPRSPPRG